MSAIPNRIHLYWHQGWHTAPKIVRYCIDRWRSLNPGHDVVIHDAEDIAVWLDWVPFDWSVLQIQAISDLLRISILHREGGIWADASLLPLQPLTQWLPDPSEGGLFAFDHVTADRIVASWFLAATPGSPLVVGWMDQVKRYWDRPRTLQALDGNPFSGTADMVAPAVAPTCDAYPYFWFHYLFAQMLALEPELGDLWSRSAKLPAGPAHALQRYMYRHQTALPNRLLKLIPKLQRARQRARVRHVITRHCADTPVQKLTTDLAWAFSENALL